ncbi:hypothetical protein KFK09_003325 [Dendrobium nobile]|uniref:ABC transporter domain-containing protein n=1 Tax=Dendrobium nobile TaxID=94219 RepID=A0A8T3C2U1_DENNO|nr:hypothetical protein KFK09_003325 [Dendrobium nobile]
MREKSLKSLGVREKKMLVERLLPRDVDEDNKTFLLKIKDRFERVGMEWPTIEVRFQDIVVEAQVYVGNRSIPSFFNSFLNSAERFANFLHLIPSKKKPFTILQDASGVIKPHRMTLLLGPPGSGKTTLLKTLSGKLQSDLKVSGEVTYNGYQMNEFVPQRTAAYINQYDVHIGEMTVRETLEFSARYMLSELLKRESEANIQPDQDLDAFMKAVSGEGRETGVITEYIMKILGLDGCADTLIGNDMHRGISGGEKKRVTTGEMIVGPMRALFMDEISTGLDTSTTFQIVNSLRQSVQILGLTTVVSLLQPAPETYELFDDIILLSDGYIVYQGPLEHVLHFFESMGFKCPERKSVPDFLQEVTSRKDQRQYWGRNDESYEYVPVRKFVEAFQSFYVGKRVERDLSVPYDRSKCHPDALTTSRYGVGIIDLLKACSARELLLIKRNSIVYAFRAFQVMFVALVMITLYGRKNMHHNTVNDGIIFMGSLYLSIAVIITNGLSELAMTVIKLPVFFRQNDHHFYSSWAYAIPAWILKIPFSFLEVAIWVIITYHAVGFDPSATRFIKQYLLLFLVHQMAAGMFRLVAVIGRIMVIAYVIGSFVFIANSVLSGFIISHEAVKKWWIWGYWVSPFMYSQNAISINEFHGRKWSQIISGSNQTLGFSILKSRGVFQDENWYWIGASALFGYVLLFNFLYTISLSYFKPLGNVQSTISEKTLEEREINRMGKLIGLSSGMGGSNRQFSFNKVRDPSVRIGMVLPFIPLYITFDKIRYSVDMPKEKKTRDKLVILNGVSGYFRPGVLTALMGVSGAGKTTLMDVLAGRKTGGYIEGNITISGYPKKKETFARMLGYCEQNDIHSPNVTVYESLIFSAWLRLPVEVDSLTKKMFIEEIMELVELTSIRETVVGLPGVNGLSTEQRKRLTIAVELVSNPSIIFMDEPTSGLDARSASIVMRTVRNIVETKRTIVCTIHQPSIDIFESFDELLLLKLGGKQIYFGPLGHHSFNLISYFEGIEGIRKIRDGYNPATWMLEVTTTAQEHILEADFSEIYKNSELHEKNKAIIAELSIPPPGSDDLHFSTQYPQMFHTQCIACLWKQHLSYWRNPPYTALRFLFTILIALLFGTIFWDLGSKRSKQQDLINAMGSMYCAALFLGVFHSNGVQPTVAIERKVFYRERASGMYSAMPYAFGQVVVEQPYLLTQSLLYTIIVFLMIGFEWTAAKVFWYMFFTYSTLSYYTYYGMMTVGLTPNQSIAAIVAAAFYSIWNIFSGFLIPRTRMPMWCKWYYWVCPLAWTLYGLISSQYGDDNNLLDTNETVAEFVKSYFGYRHDYLGVVAVVVILFASFFAIMFGVAIKFLNYQTK